MADAWLQEETERYTLLSSASSCAVPTYFRLEESSLAASAYALVARFRLRAEMVRDAVGFVVTARDFSRDDPMLSQINIDMGTRIQPQDEEAIAAVEQVLQSVTGPVREISARVDTGALKVRHRLEKQIRDEMLRRQPATRACSLEVIR